MNDRTGREPFLFPEIDRSRQGAAGTMLLACGVVFVVALFDGIWSGSVDIAHHYALIEYFFEYFHAPHGPTLHLGEMSRYPHYSHALAALAGRFLGSPLMGMQLVALLSVYALWAALAVMLASIPPRRAVVLLVAVFALFVLNRYALHAELFGREIVSNYFFAELVAQALCAWAYALMLLMERRGVSSALRYAFCVIVVHVAVRTHLLPAVELYGALGLLVILDVFAAPWPHRMRAAMVGGVALLAGCAVIVLDPAFATMRILSTNNGALSLHWIPDQPALAALAGMVLVLSSVLLLPWLKPARIPGRQSLAGKYLACLAAAAALLCMLQIFLLRFGFGSEYAARKYAFILQTLALIEVAMLVSDWIASRLPSRATAVAGRKQAAICALLPALFLLCMLTLGFLPARGATVANTSRLVALESSVFALRDHVLEPSPAGKYDFVVGIKDTNWIYDYLLSIGILHAPRTGSTLNFILGKPSVDEPTFVGHILTSAGSLPWDRGTCRQHAFASGIVVLDGACVMRSSHRSDCSGAYDFSTAGFLPIGAFKGFGGPESNGRWSDGPRASMHCVFDSGTARPTRMRIIANGHLSAGPQRMLVSINGDAPRTYVYSKTDPAPDVSLDLSATAGPDLDVRFEFPDAHRAGPRDARQISVFFRKIEFH